MEDQKNKEAAQQPNSDVERSAGSEPQTASDKKEDISEVDQQEGQMDNGELGGNFNSAPGDAGKQKSLSS